MKTVTATGAIGLAVALLGLQLVLALEYTEGGTLGTRASMIFAMVTLALLPVFIETARRNGNRALALALGVAFLAFLAYSLPATTGRTGEIKETKVSAAADVARIRDDIQRTNVTLEWARSDWIAECGTGEGKKCRAKRNTVQALEDRIGKLTADLKAAGTQPGDLGSDLWSWATGLPPETVRKLSVLSFAIGIDVAIWSLIWLATSLLVRPVQVANDNRPSLKDTMQTDFPVDPDGGSRKRVFTRNEAMADVISLVERRKPIPSQDDLADRWGVTKSAVSKWLTLWEEDGLIQRESVGRCKTVKAA
jgi:hypothetical protein